MTTEEQTDRLTLLGFEQGKTYVVERDGSYHEQTDEERDRERIRELEVIRK